MISVVSPVYRAEKILPVLVEEIHKTLTEMGEDYEIILVDDRSPDNSWKIMQDLAQQYRNLKIFRLSKNFGQHATITVGLTKAAGEWIVVMDCDMQDQPKEIKWLYEKTKEGYDLVLAQRTQRQDSLSKKIGSKLFYKVFNYLAGIKINNEIANFGIYHKKVIREVLKMKDYIKFFPLFVQWVGFNSAELPVEHSSREEGVTSYSFSKLVSLAFNVIISFSDKPLKIFIYSGGVISMLALLMGAFYLIKYFLGDITEPGFTSLILSIWFLSGMIISCIGIVGVYLGKTFNQTKGRPVFIIDEE